MWKILSGGLLAIAVSGSAVAAFVGPSVPNAGRTMLAEPAASTAEAAPVANKGAKVVRSGGAVAKKGPVGTPRVISRQPIVKAPARTFKAVPLAKSRPVLKVFPPSKSVVIGPRGQSAVFVRSWKRRPHYGRIVAGIALGSILAASAYYAYERAPPAPGLCWYWTNSSETRGYWDYCSTDDDDDDDD